MKFIIEYTGSAEQRVLIYDVEECSFDMRPIVLQVSFNVIINTLNLTVVDDNKITQLWGFCGLGKEMESDCTVPESEKGALKVIDELEPGFCYGVNDTDLPVQVNAKTGWVCIGHADVKGNAVEFIDNCIAVIDDNDEFVSLWLKPKKLPPLK